MNLVHNFGKMVYLNGIPDCKGCEMLRNELEKVKYEKMKLELEYENKLKLEFQKGYHSGAFKTLSNLPGQSNSPINLDTPSPPAPAPPARKQKRSNFTSTPTAPTPPPPFKHTQQPARIPQEPAKIPQERAREPQEPASVPTEKSNEDSGEDDEDEPPPAIFQKDVLARSPVKSARRQAPPPEGESRKKQKTAHPRATDYDTAGPSRRQTLSEDSTSNTRRTIFIPSTREDDANLDTSFSRRNSGVISRDKGNKETQKEKTSAKTTKGVHMTHVPIKPLPTPSAKKLAPKESAKRHTMDSVITDPIILKAQMVNNPLKYNWEMTIYQINNRDRTTITMEPDFSYNSSEQCYICVGMFQRPLHISLGDFLHKRYAKQTTQMGQIIPVQSQFSMTPADGPLGFQLTAEDTTLNNPLVLHSKESIKFVNITSSSYTIDSHPMYNFQKYTTVRKYGPRKGSSDALKSEISFIFRHNTRGKLTANSTAGQLLSLVSCEIRLYPKTPPKASSAGDGASRRHR